MTGNNIRLRNINFKPTAELLNEVARQVRFERSKYTTKSRRYTEEQLWDKIVAFIKEHRLYLPTRHGIPFLPAPADSLEMVEAILPRKGFW